MPYHTVDSMNWGPKDDAVIPRWVTIKNCASSTHLTELLSFIELLHRWITLKVVIFARVIFRASAIFDIFACF